MNKKEIGHTGEYVFPIGLGTYKIKSYKRAMESFLHAIQSGVELIDTAQIYGTEDFVGELIKKAGRKKIFVVTKIWPDKLYSEDLVQKAAENSLKRLGVPYVDLMLIHWPNREISIKKEVKNFEIVSDILPAVRCEGSAYRLPYGNHFTHILGMSYRESYGYCSTMLYTKVLNKDCGDSSPL